MKTIIKVLVNPLAVIVVSLFVIAGCSDDDDNDIINENLPTLTTTGITGITTTTATSGGNITDDGGLPVTQRGVVWSTVPEPNIENNDGITSDGTGSGTFTSNITDLSPGTFYYLKAYATNNNGTDYGNQQIFKTLGQVPTVLTRQATEITPEGAVLNASVNPSHLETTVIFEWGLTDEYGNENTAEQSPIDGSTDVSVSAFIDGLEPGTLYRFRVVAENALGVVYGNATTFTTYGLDDPQDIDGNYYRTVIIGNHEWMAENLRVTKYNNGDDIPTELSNAEWQNTTAGAYAIYDHNAPNAEGINSPEEMVEAYGKLYNFFAVDDQRGLCPAGWHVPSDDDWTTLVDYFVSQGYPNEWNNPNGAGNALKSCRQVNSPLGGECNTSTHPRWNSHGSPHSGFDKFGFSGLPGGRRFSYGSFGNVGNLGFWWSATATTGSTVRSVGYSYGSVSRSYELRSDGYSVRCLRDID